MRPIDLLGIELCEFCRPYLEPVSVTSTRAGVMRSYYCEHSMSALGILHNGKLVAVYATSDPCTQIDWARCRLNPANRAGA